MMMGGIKFYLVLTIEDYVIWGASLLANDSLFAKIPSTLRNNKRIRLQVQRLCVDQQKSNERLFACNDTTTLHIYIDIFTSLSK